MGSFLEILINNWMNKQPNGVKQLMRIFNRQGLSRACGAQKTTKYVTESQISTKQIHHETLVSSISFASNPRDSGLLIN